MSRILTALKRLEQRGAVPSAPAVDAAIASTAATSSTATSLPANPQTPPVSSVISPPWPGNPAAAEVAPITLPISAAGGFKPRGVDSSVSLPMRRATDRYVPPPCYAALCENILSRWPIARPLTLLVVPAAAEGDASTVVAELALAMAQSLDEEILAVDADVFATASNAAEDQDGVAAAGLSNALEGKVDWRAVVTPTRQRRVQLLSSGRPLSAGAIKPATARAAPMFAEIKMHYRRVLVHGGLVASPLLAALAKSSDLVYVVIDLERTTRRSARSAKRRLENLGALVHGCILRTG